VGIAHKQAAYLMFDAEIYHFASPFVAQIPDALLVTLTHLASGLLQLAITLGTLFATAAFLGDFSQSF
jgi:hypothetical protein